MASKKTQAKQPVNHVLSVGEVAARCGVAVSTLHFYEEKGLIESTRNAGNQRRYRRDIIRRVSLIKVAQSLGVSLAEIAAAFATLPNGRKATQKDWQRLSRQWSAQLQSRIDQLTRLRSQLTECIGCGCLSVQSCPLRNPEDRLSQQGPGPHLIQD